MKCSYLVEIIRRHNQHRSLKYNLFNYVTWANEFDQLPHPIIYELNCSVFKRSNGTVDNKSYNVCQWVLNALKLVEICLWDARVKWIAVVKFAGDKWICKSIAIILISSVNQNCKQTNQTIRVLLDTTATTQHHLIAPNCDLFPPNYRLFTMTVVCLMHRRFSFFRQRFSVQYFGSR